ncbi:MAG: hypothetical protein BGO34_11745 [Bacteroidia bacterium 44-10]|nr:MAG: hypothetical protein BGO34_11745 [Bacteroidia bacterium 44-10]
MLKGTQDGTRVSLSVRQKHPLHAKGTGRIGGLTVDAVVALGIGLKDVRGFIFVLHSPIPAVPE